MSPLGFVGVPAAAAGKFAPPFPAPETESDPPLAALYAALPTSEPVIEPLDTKSRQVVAPDVAKLDALLASNSNVGEEETAAFTGTKFPESPIAITSAPSNVRTVRDFTPQDYLSIHAVNQNELTYDYAMPRVAKTKNGFAPKVCVRCGLEFEWRKKWTKNWTEVKYCSDRCRENK